MFQTDISKKFPAPYTSTGLMCFLASFQCMFIALCFDHSASAWSLHDAMRLSAALYAVHAHATLKKNWYTLCIDSYTKYMLMLVAGNNGDRVIVFPYVMGHWEKRSPLCIRIYPFAVSPHCRFKLGFAAREIICWNVRKSHALLFFTNQNNNNWFWLTFVFLFSALGSLLIVLGLYAVLWGKSEEVSTEDGNERSNEGFEEWHRNEMQYYVPSNGNRVSTWRCGKEWWSRVRKMAVAMT